MPDGAIPVRVDRYVTDATGLSRSHVQKLIAAGNLTGSDGAPLRSNAIVGRRRPPAPARAGGDPAGARTRAGHRPPGRLRGRRPAHRRQAGRPRRPPVARSFDGDDGPRAARPAGRRGVRRHRRRRPAGDRPPARPRHERPDHGRQARRRPDGAHGPAQGAPDQEDVPGPRPRRRSAAAVGRIEAPIGRDPRQRTRMAVVPDGRPSVTGYRVRERFDGWTLLELDLITGRTHQIRVHLDAIGHPGRRRPGLRHRARRGGGRTGLERLFLHAWRLELASPTDGHLIRAEAPLPPALESVLDGLRARGGGPMTSAGAGSARGSGRAGAILVIICGPVRRRQGHDHRRAARTGPHDPDYHYVVTCTTRAPRPGEVDGVSVPLPRSRPLPARCATPASCSRRTEVHGNWYGTPRDEVRDGARGRPRRDPQDRRPGRPGGQGAGRRTRSSSSSSRRRSRPSSNGCKSRATEIGRRARGPPAQRRDRARPAGRLRLRRGQRDRPGRADGRPDRRDHRGRAAAATRSARSSSRRGRPELAPRGGRARRPLRQCDR